MPDFTMCFGEEKQADGTTITCPLRETCYRFIADPEPKANQTFFTNVPYREDSCQYYWQTYCEDVD